MRPVNLLAIVLALLAPAPASAQTEWPIDGVAPGGVSYASSNAYPKGDYYTHLQSASGDAPNACDWGWGCGGSPYRTGPGQCDTWRVGPVWRGSLEGLVMYRDKTDIVALAGAADAGGVALPLNADAVTSNFEHGAGVRLSVTGNYPQCRGYEMNVTYLGIFKWDAGAFNPEVPQAGPIGPQPDLIVQRSLSYRSSLHSLAFNGQTTGDDRVKLFGGMRYVRLSEDIDDLYDEESPTPSLAPVLVDDLELTDILRNVAVDNNLIGFQGGVRSDLLSLGERFYISGFANAGAYCNLIQRSTTYEQTDTFSRVDDNATAMDIETVSVTQTARTGYKSDRVRGAFVTEAALNAVYQVNACTQAQLGYQVLYLNGVEFGDEAFLGADPTSSDLLLHGWFAGVEYRR